MVDQVTELRTEIGLDVLCMAHLCTGEGAACQRGVILLRPTPRLVRPLFLRAVQPATTVDSVRYLHVLALCRRANAKTLSLPFCMKHRHH